MGVKGFGFESVETYLQKGIYYIPDYQREYSWEKDEQIDDFWIDLSSAVEEKRGNHFFGQVVIHENQAENKKYIIDGQQRTTTSIIFFAVLRDLFEEIYVASNYSSSRNKVEDIRLKFIGRWSPDENELRFTLGKVDAEYFKDNIQIQKPEKGEIPREASHKRIKEAYEYLESMLRNQLEDLPSYVEKHNLLLDYYNKFKDDFKLMYVETDDINEAFIIFETLNARGKDLETSDLLKNHLFRSSGKLIDKVKDEWLSTVDNLENIDLTKFLRHYWNSKYAFTREKDLYKKLRSLIDTPKKCEEFVGKLYEMSDVYKALVNPNDFMYFQDQELQKILKGLKLFGASTYYPIILAMVENKYSESDIQCILARIETFIFRNCVVAGKVANKYEILFSRIAQQIADKTIITLDEINKKFEGDLLTDDEFTDAFKVLTIKKSTVAKYVLREINDSFNKEVQVLSDNAKIHLEHIMPRKIGDWNVSQEVHEKYINRLGNLTLLANEYNKSISNKSFDFKKGIYKNSDIKITSQLCKYEKWDETTIEQRQNEYLEIAKKRWKY